MKKTRHAFFLICFYSPRISAAERGPAPISHLTPIGMYAASPMGVVFPAFNSAAIINPGALTLEKGASVETVYGPPIGGGNVSSFGASIAAARRTLGFTAGYLGQHDTTFTNGAFVGTAFRANDFGFGASLVDRDITSGFSPSVELGAVLKTAGGVQAGAVLYDVTKAPQLGFGVGYSSGKQFFLEANMLLPSFTKSASTTSTSSTTTTTTPGIATSATATNEYIFTVAASANVAALGFFFNSSYFMASKAFVHTLGAMAWLGTQFYVSGQYSTHGVSSGAVYSNYTNNYFTFGLGYAFQ